MKTSKSSASLSQAIEKNRRRYELAETSRQIKLKFYDYEDAGKSEKAKRIIAKIRIKRKNAGSYRRFKLWESEEIVTVESMIKYCSGDSWDHLRAGDLYRLLEYFEYSEQSMVAQCVAIKRPDLDYEVNEALADMEADLFG